MSNAQLIAHVRTPRTALILLALCAGAPTALAQNALDANLRKGSGGRNDAGRDPIKALNYQRDIVTGNATDGKAFRGEIGYTGTSDFRGSLGSNDLFSFQRDAFLSGLITSGVRTQDALHQLRSNATGNTGTGSLAGTFSLSRSGTGALYDARAQSIQATPSLLTSFGNLALKPSSQTGDYRGRTLDSSTGAPVAPANDSTPTSPEGTDPSTMNLTSSWDTSNQIIKAFGDQMRTRSEETPTLAIVNAQLAQRFGPQAITREAIKPSSPFAREPLSPYTAQSAYTSILENIDTIDDTENSTDPAISSWQEQLDAALAQFDEDIELSRQNLTRSEPAGQPGEENTDPSVTIPDDKPQPTNAELIANAGQNTTQAANESRDYSSAITGERLGRLALSPSFVRSMSRDIGIVNSLVLQNTDVMSGVYRNEMEAAQAELSTGRYFAAEERFKRAINAKPTDPMARIGRVHAQLGAGLYISAGINLNKVFEAHPELVGVKYDTTLLPGRDRWEEMRGKLLAAMDNRGSLATEAAMLYAYMAYQFGDNDAIIVGATKMVELRPEDKIYRLSATVWVASTEEVPAAPDPK